MFIDDPYLDIYIYAWIKVGMGRASMRVDPTRLGPARFELAPTQPIVRYVGCGPATVKNFVSGPTQHELSYIWHVDWPWQNALLFVFHFKTTKNPSVP